MTELPEGLGIIHPYSEKITPLESKKEYRHNWLYSFSPVFDYPAVYLVGYCKICDQAFSRIVPLAEKIQITKMDVPKFGCIEQTMP